MTYAQIAALSRSHYNQNRFQKLRPGAKLGVVKPLTTFVVVLIAVCLLLVVYLLQVNHAHSYSYVINDLQQEKQLLQEEFEALSLEAVKLESNQRISGDLSENYLLPETVYFD